MVRSLVIASATLAILLVCFSIYQFSQTSPRPDRQRTSRLETSTPAQTADDDLSDASGDVAVGGATVGAGRNITLSIYPRVGTQARLEIEVRDWRPVEGSAEEFLLIDPLIRMRTNNGHAVRVTAGRGILEASRQGRGGLDPRRGRLTGGVVIEIDRFSDEERAASGAPANAEPDPSELVRIEMEEIEFDLEYSKVVVPGDFTLSASDVHMEASDLEVRFNERENRVEHLRIGRSGRIELRQQGDQMGLAMPGFGDKSPKSLTIVEWIRHTLEAKLAAQQQMASANAITPDNKKDEDQDQVTYTDDGTPIFRLGDGDDDTAINANPPIRYLAKFEGKIDAVHTVAGVTQSRLRADVLEILRDFSEQERKRMRPAQTPGGDTATAKEKLTASTDNIVLTWSQRLVVNAVKPDETQEDNQVRSRITARGSPVQLSTADGDVSCLQLTFEPDGDKIWLTGSDQQPVVVRSPDQGDVQGVKIYSQRSADGLWLVRVDGPGSLERLAGDDELLSSADPIVGDQDVPAIEFDDTLELHGRTVSRTSMDFTGRISTRSLRVLDRAVFAGGVKMRESDTDLSADQLVAFFSQPRRRNDRPTVTRVEGRGDVHMRQGKDQLSCEEIDIEMTTDRNGQAIPLTATARGNVEVVQQERVIRAKDKLIVDFVTFSRPAPPFDAMKAYAIATKAGINPATVDWDARRKAQASKREDVVGVARLQAFGGVTVTDPGQLDVTCEQLDCDLVDGTEIQTALVIGTEERPATVRMETFTVTGQRVSLDVPNQWAEVPGEGMLRFRSRRDLDGRRLDEPIPIVIKWSDWMKYEGRENRSVFEGNVHATSQTMTTFDGQRLVVEFDDVAQPSDDKPATQDWWIFNDLAARLANSDKRSGNKGMRARFSKEPAYIAITGDAVAQTAEIDPVTGKLMSRARITGPKLSVNLRPDVSKMLIEGAGNLLLEDYRPAPENEADATPTEGGGLFSLDRQPGPSVTLIEWNQLMWYDFSIDQTRFEGDVTLKHVSGSQLDRVFGETTPKPGASLGGRSTFLTCGLLTVDFLQRDEQSRPRGSGRMGGLSADRLRQFRASRSVTLQDEGLWLTADDVIYERDRNMLAVQGSPQRKAHIVTQRPGEYPIDITTERFFYNIATHRIEGRNIQVKGR